MAREKQIFVTARDFFKRINYNKAELIPRMSMSKRNASISFPSRKHVHSQVNIYIACLENLFNKQPLYMELKVSLPCYCKVGIHYTITNSCLWRCVIATKERKYVYEREYKQRKKYVRQLYSNILHSKISKTSFKMQYLKQIFIFTLLLQNLCEYIIVIFKSFNSDFQVQIRMFLKIQYTMSSILVNFEKFYYQIEMRVLDSSFAIEVKCFA